MGMVSGAGVTGEGKPMKPLELYVWVGADGQMHAGEQEPHDPAELWKFRVIEKRDKLTFEPTNGAYAPAPGRIPDQASAKSGGERHKPFSGTGGQKR